MKPRADWVCNAKGCRETIPDGDGATAQRQYELPVDAKVCPYGHRSIKRLFNAINVIGSREVQPETDPRLTSSSPTVVKDALMRPGFDVASAHTSTGSDPKKVGGRLRSWAIPNVSMADPSYQSQVGQGRPMREMERAALARHDPQPQHISNVLAAIARQPIPTRVAGR
jgi:hypothetical protein